MELCFAKFMTPYLSYSACPFTDIPFPHTLAFLASGTAMCGIPLKAAVFRTFKRCDSIGLLLHSRRPTLINSFKL